MRPKSTSIARPSVSKQKKPGPSKNNKVKGSKRGPASRKKCFNNRFICQKCDRAIDNAATSASLGFNLVQHAKVHCDLFQWSCEMCAYRSRWKRTIIRHNERIHQNQASLKDSLNEAMIKKFSRAAHECFPAHANILKTWNENQLKLFKKRSKPSTNASPTKNGDLKEKKCREPITQTKELGTAVEAPETKQIKQENLCDDVSEIKERLELFDSRIRKIDENIKDAKEKQAEGSNPADLHEAKELIDQRERELCAMIQKLQEHCNNPICLESLYEREAILLVALNNEEEKLVELDVKREAYYGKMGSQEMEMDRLKKAGQMLRSNLENRLGR